MKIVATILAHNSANMIANAIGSVRDLVDEIILIDTGITDSTLEAASASVNDHAKLVVEHFDWINDFAAARNAALNFASAREATWSLTIDTDEMLCYPTGLQIDALKSFLASNPSVHIWQCPVAELTYQKDRMIRVDRPGKYAWKYRVHECLTGFDAQVRQTLPGFTFKEFAKTSFQTEAKLTRDLDALLADIALSPHDARLWFYLGQTYEEMNRATDAINAYTTASSRLGWKEETAAAAFRAAWVAYQIGKFKHARGLCAQTLALDPSWPEAFWLAGACSLALRDLDAAVIWERMAISIGHVEGLKLGLGRVVYCNLHGWFEGPYKILHQVFESLGQVELTREMETMAKRAESFRVQHIVAYNSKG